MKCRGCNKDLEMGKDITVKEKSGYGLQCRSCRSEQQWDSKIKRLFGIRGRDYHAILKSQGGGCAICGTEKDANGKNHMAIDHDHSKDYMDIRGILCSKCNQGIGMFDDNTSYMKNAINYLGGTA